MDHYKFHASAMWYGSPALRNNPQQVLLKPSVLREYNTDCLYYLIGWLHVKHHLTIGIGGDVLIKVINECAYITATEEAHRLITSFIDGWETMKSTTGGLLCQLVPLVEK